MVDVFNDKVYPVFIYRPKQYVGNVLNKDTTVDFEDIRQSFVFRYNCRNRGDKEERGWEICEYRNGVFF